MATDLTIRPATVDDIEDIQRVARRSWDAAYEDVLEQATIDDLLGEGYSTDVLEAWTDAETAELLVATDDDDDETVGYASATVEDEERVADLNVYVEPDHWRRGVGTDLLAAMEDRLADRDVERVRDYVLAHNEPGNAFYREHFERVDDREVEIGGEMYTANVYERTLE